MSTYPYANTAYQNQPTMTHVSICQIDFVGFQYENVMTELREQHRKESEDELQNRAAFQYEEVMTELRSR